MPEQRQREQRNPEEDEVVQDEPAEQDTDVSDEADDLLDEIDGVLEENPEIFVNGYVQEGGQ